MKKTLIALAALAATGAFAQSSVTLYGVVDLGISHGSGSGTGSTTLDQMSSGNINSSRLGVKGVEDLGGGLKASFVLEGDVKPFSGTGATTGAPAAGASNNNVAVVGTSGGFTFNRQATLGVIGGFGEVRLGRDYTPTFYVDAVYDPFGVNGVGTNAIFGNGNAYTINHLRVSDAVSYISPNLSGFSGQLTFSLNNTASGTTAATTQTQDDGKFTGAVVGYSQGPLSAHVASATEKLFALGDVTTTSLGAAYDLGVAKLMMEYSTDQKGSAAFNQKIEGTLLGVTAPLGSGVLKASYVTRKITADNQVGDNYLNQTTLGYVYMLSPRTALYATASSISNTGASAVGANGAVTAAGTSSSGYDIGIRHSF